MYGKWVRDECDCCTDGGAQTHAINLGEFDLIAGENTLTVTAVGNNEKGRQEHLFGLDYLLLRPIDAAKCAKWETT